ncbi:PAS domain S-box protein [bacterium]|nr:MAG: PAS domain S-box protein [bacterium]
MAEIQGNATALCNAEGEITGASESARDLTARQNDEKNLAERESFLSGILDSIQDEISVLDKELTIVRVNSALKRRFSGGGPLVGRKCVEVYHCGTEFCEDCPSRITLRSGKVSSKIFSETKNGAVIWLELVTFPIFDPKRTLVTGVIALARDITERKRAEEESLRRRAAVEKLNGSLVELARNEKIYGGDAGVAFRAITEASARAMAVGRVSIWFYTGGNSGIVCKDMYEARRGTHSEGMILYARDYPAYFSALEEEYCLCADDALGDPRTSEFSETYLRPLGITSMLDVPIIVADKTIGLVCHEHTGTPRKWTVEEQSYATAVAGFASMSLEILARKRAEEGVRKLNDELEQKVGERTRQLLSAQEELIRKEKLAILGQLSGSVGHELRNPLGVMNNAVFYLKMVLSDPPGNVREYLDIIKNEIDNSERIIADLLDFARTKKPQIRTMTVREIVEAGLDRCPIPENVAVEFAIPEDIPPLRADPLQMGQVFQNLFVNAVQAMPGGGSLRVGAKIKPGATGLEPDFIEISAADTGEGILEENLGKIFQPLFTTKAKGIGLGLVVCRNLTELNGGKIRVESRPGEGTVFTVSLPAAGTGMGESQ